MSRYEAVKMPDGTAIIVDTQTPGDSAHGRASASCPDISTAVEMTTALNS